MQIKVSDSSSIADVWQKAVRADLHIPESEYHLYHLVDRTDKEILCLHCYVRDIYMFKKPVKNNSSFQEVRTSFYSNCAF